MEVGGARVALLRDERMRAFKGDPLMMMRFGSTHGLIIRGATPILEGTGFGCCGVGLPRTATSEKFRLFRGVFFSTNKQQYPVVTVTVTSLQLVGVGGGGFDNHF